ncbi:MAG: SLC45 family MFS transporter [Ruminococcaceae bacterium]|nr:SLC45 family MFS transporter [Oscillospiraceae bacterium]MBQ9913463.1 MFS transporter [Clostridia bacterium]
MAEQKQKLNVKLTILTGFGFMASSIAWAIYDPYITKILNKLLSESAFVTSLSAKLNEAIPFLAEFARSQGEDVGFGSSISLVPLFIGIIMTFDNIFGVIFQPTFGKLSDNCHSKLGKRRPFIVFGAPVSALLFAIIPFVALKTGSLPATMVFIILFVFTMSLWRAPVVALMPDLTPPELRSEGNAIINLMGGIGSAVGMVAGTLAAAIYALLFGKATEESQTFPIVFIIGSVVMVAGALVLLFFVKEQDSRVQIKADRNMALDTAAKKKAEKEAQKAEKAARKANKLSAGERKSLLFMLACLFFLFCGTNAITTFFSLFAQEILHMATAQATIIMAIFAVCSAAAAIPAGKMGRKIGRKKTIMAGLSVFISAFLVFFLVFTVMVTSQGLSVNKYVQSNKVYANIDTAVNEVNTTLKQEHNDAVEAGTAEGEYEALTIDGYIEYLNAPAEGSSYEMITAALEENSGGEFHLDNLISTSNNIIGKEVAEGAYGEALSNIKESVDGIVKVLKILIYPVLVLAGFANMFITVNTLPLVLEIGGIDKVGTFTGYYYTATFSAQIASPIVYGAVAMVTGTYMSLFYYSPIAFLICLGLILFVKHGEAISQDVIDKIEEENAD